MTRSITSSSASSWSIVSRASTSPTRPAGSSGGSAAVIACMGRVDRAEAARSAGTPCGGRGRRGRTLCSARLVWIASLPPLMRRPLPLRSARAATCGSASGRDSTITSSTPSGDVRCSSTSPSASSVRRSTCRDTTRHGTHPRAREGGVGVGRRRRAATAAAAAAPCPRARSRAPRSGECPRRRSGTCPGAA